MRLEKGKTKIGTIPSKDGEDFDVYYGNMVKKSDGRTARLSEEMYQKILASFKSTDAYKNYEEYQEELEAEEKKKAQEAAAKKAAQQAELEKNKAALQAAGVEAVKKSIDNNMAQLQELAENQENTDRRLASIQESINALVAMQKPQNESENSDDEVPDDEDEYEDEPAGLGLIGTALLVIILMVSVASLGISGYQLFAGQNNTPAITEKEPETDKITVTLDGETYEIDKTQVELADGETSIQLYGIRTTNNGGETVKEIIPIGDLKIAAEEPQKSEEQNTDEPADNSETIKTESEDSNG